MFIVKLADLNHTAIDLSLLSPQTILEAEKYQHGSRSKQFLVCRSILASLLKNYYDIPVLPEIYRDHNQRPHFCDPALPSFNISHSRQFVAVAITTQELAQVGVDIEVDRARKNYLAIANAFFSADENQWLQMQANPLDAFWQLWTLKESALKLYSKGVWQMKSVHVDPVKKAISTPFANSIAYQYRQLQFDQHQRLHLSVSSNKTIDDFVLL
ncbi:4'-phosphopantetheinyl transferase superfamily protein [Orbaceae bacterium ESL0721]|nr:4'-phosphopantetheinyl transferase superfamily protein [Orbaceae bacterium ESL0721]